jgi:hypothetical protein
MRLLNVFPLLLMLATAPAGAAMFKWTDANGNVQYGQFPPAGSQAERLKSAPPAPASAPAGKSLQQRVEEMEKHQDSEQQRKAETAQKQQEAANRKTNCENARKNIERLNYGGNRLMHMPDGSYQRLDEKQKQEQLEKNRKAIKEFCD